MSDFLASADTALLERHGLNGFDQLWALQLDAVDEPNTGRGGWSSVYRLELEGKGFYLKRQSDYLTRTLHSPFGEPTFAREFRNIKRYQKLNIPALQAVFFAERRVDGERGWCAHGDNRAESGRPGLLHDLEARPGAHDEHRAGQRQRTHPGRGPHDLVDRVVPPDVLQHVAHRTAHRGPGGGDREVVRNAVECIGAVGLVLVAGGVVGQRGGCGGGRGFGQHLGGRQQTEQGGKHQG